VSDQDPIREQLAELGLRPALDDEPGDEMQIRTRVDVVRDAGRDDREDGRGALAADVEPGEEPVSSAEDQPPELALATTMPGPGLCRIGAAMRLRVGGRLPDGGLY
jgi:hypothetical protein